MSTLFAVLWTGLSLGQSDLTHGGATTWEALAAERIAYVETSRWRHSVEQLKAKGFSIESVRECLAAVQEAARQGLPADFVLTRIEEGVAKGAEATVLKEAAQQRLLDLQNAASILLQSGYGSRNAVHDQLMKSVTLALESGLSAETLQSVLTQAKGEQSERMRSIVEAGEMMRLSGMDENTIALMMTDFIERNLRRTEVMRASRFAVQKHRAHMEGDRIRQQLWDRTGLGGRRGHGESSLGSGGPSWDGSGPADRGSGPRESDGQGRQGGSSISPGYVPRSNGSGGHGGEGGKGSGEAGGQKGETATVGPQSATQNRGQ